MIVTVAAVVLAFIGAVAMAVSGIEYERKEPFRGTFMVGVTLIALALAMVKA